MTIHRDWEERQKGYCCVMFRQTLTASSSIKFFSSCVCCTAACTNNTHVCAIVSVRVIACISLSLSLSLSLSRKLPAAPGWRKQRHASCRGWMSHTACAPATATALHQEGHHPQSSSTLCGLHRARKQGRKSKHERDTVRICQFLVIQGAICSFQHALAGVLPRYAEAVLVRVARSADTLPNTGTKLKVPRDGTACNRRCVRVSSSDIFTWWSPTATLANGGKGQSREEQRVCLRVCECDFVGAFMCVPLFSCFFCVLILCSRSKRWPFLPPHVAYSTEW